MRSGGTRRWRRCCATHPAGAGNPVWAPGVLGEDRWRWSRSTGAPTSPAAVWTGSRAGRENGWGDRVRSVCGRRRRVGAAGRCVRHRGAQLRSPVLPDAEYLDRVLTEALPCPRREGGWSLVTCATPPRCESCDRRAPTPPTARLRRGAAIVGRAGVAGGTRDGGLAGVVRRVGPAPRRRRGHPVEVRCSAQRTDRHRLRGRAAQGNAFDLAVSLRCRWKSLTTGRRTARRGSPDSPTHGWSARFAETPPGKPADPGGGARLGSGIRARRRSSRGRATPSALRRGAAAHRALCGLGHVRSRRASRHRWTNNPAHAKAIGPCSPISPATCATAARLHGSTALVPLAGDSAHPKTDKPDWRALPPDSPTTSRTAVSPRNAHERKLLRDLLRTSGAREGRRRRRLLRPRRAFADGGALSRADPQAVRRRPAAQDESCSTTIAALGALVLAGGIPWRTPTRTRVVLPLNSDPAPQGADLVFTARWPWRAYFTFVLHLPDRQAYNPAGTGLDGTGTLPTSVEEMIED